jgi:hypothetical protein
MAAILYSLVETANVCGIDPIAYLVEVATRARRSPGGRPTSCRLQSHQRRRVNGARLLWPVCRRHHGLRRGDTEANRRGRLLVGSLDPTFCLNA